MDNVATAIRERQSGTAEPVLLPAQERLLVLVAHYQREFAASKLIVARPNGTLHFDDDAERGVDLSLVHELYGATASLSPRDLKH